MIKAVIFDVDGVMVITEHLHYEAWKKFCEKRGMPLELDYYLENLSGRRSQEILMELSGNFEGFEKLRDEKEDYFKKIAKGKIKPIPGLYRLLQELKKGYKIGVATSIPRINIGFYLKNLKIKEFIDALTIADDIKEGKPNPEIYLKTAEKLGVKPKEGVVIEDAKSGLKSAKNAGMKCIIVLNDYNKNFDFSDADFIVKNIREIEEKITEMGVKNGQKRKL